MTTIHDTPTPQFAPPPPPDPPKRRFFGWRSDRPCWQTVGLFAGAVLIGTSIGSATSGTDTTVADSPSASQDAQLDRRQADLDRRQADLEADEQALNDREAGLDAREGEIAGTEATADANTFGPGMYMVGTDIQPGTYRSEGPETGDSNPMGMGYWERLSGVGGTFDELIANGVPTGPTIVEIAPTDVAFNSNGMQTWTKVG